MLWAISCADKPDTAAIRDSVLQPHRIRNARAGCLAEALSVQPVALNSTIGGRRQVSKSTASRGCRAGAASDAIRQ